VTKARTVQDVYDEMTREQQVVVAFLVGSVLDTQEIVMTTLVEHLQELLDSKPKQGEN